MANNNSRQSSAQQQTSSAKNLTQSDNYYNRARRRAQLYHRCREGARQLRVNPHKNFFVLLWVFVFAYALILASDFSASIANNHAFLSFFAVFDRVFDYEVADILILLVQCVYFDGIAILFLLILLIILSLLRRPPNLKAVEYDIASMFNIISEESRYKIPIFICALLVENATEFVFSLDGFLLTNGLSLTLQISCTLHLMLPLSSKLDA